jgi:uncharacterized protein (DUF1684 family)
MTYVSDPHLQLADYRRRVARLYQRIRDEQVAAEVRLAQFRREKDELFRTHAQSPIPLDERASFGGLAYWPHRPELRLVVPLEPDAATDEEGVPRSGGGAMGLWRIGHVPLRLDGREHRLAVYWFDDYAGGIFIPFRDATNGSETYGGGRYLWDSAKGADPGSGDTELAVDFNYAYHPSCVYDPRWSCPLAPMANRLDVPIRAGERLASS